MPWPTHIVAAAGYVFDDSGNLLIDYITSPAQRYRFQKALGFDGRVVCASYVTKPGFKLLSERYI